MPAVPTGMENQTRQRKLSSFLINTFNLKHPSITASGKKGEREMCYPWKYASRVYLEGTIIWDYAWIEGSNSIRVVGRLFWIVPISLHNSIKCIWLYTYSFQSQLVPFSTVLCCFLFSPAGPSTIVLFAAAAGAQQDFETVSMTIREMQPWSWWVRYTTVIASHGIFAGAGGHGFTPPGPSFYNCVRWCGEISLLCASIISPFLEDVLQGLILSGVRFRKR